MPSAVCAFRFEELAGKGAARFAAIPITIEVWCNYSNSFSTPMKQLQVIVKQTIARCKSSPVDSVRLAQKFQAEPLEEELFIQILQNAAVFDTQILQASLKIANELVEKGMKDQFRNSKIDIFSLVSQGSSVQEEILRFLFNTCDSMLEIERRQHPKVCVADLVCKLFKAEFAEEKHLEKAKQQLLRKIMRGRM